MCTGRQNASNRCNCRIPVNEGIPRNSATRIPAEFSNNASTFFYFKLGILREFCNYLRQYHQNSHRNSPRILKTHFIHTRIPTGIPTGIPQATLRIPVKDEEFQSCTSTVVEKKLRNNKKLPKNEEIPQPRLAHTQTAGSGRTEYRHRCPCGDHP